MMFVLMLERVISEMKIESQQDVRLKDSAISLLVYVDDVVLIEELVN